MSSIRFFVIGGIVVGGVLFAGAGVGRAAVKAVSMKIDEQVLEQGTTIDFPEGGFQLQLPEGVAAQTFSIHLQAVELPKARSNATLVSSVIEIDLRDQDVVLQKMLGLRFRFNSEKTGKKVIHFWDGHSRSWKKLPTRVDGDHASAPFPLKYGQIAVFEFPVPDEHVEFAPKAQQRQMRAKTQRKDFEVRVPKNPQAEAPVHIELKTDAGEGIEEMPSPGLQRITPIYSFDVDASEISPSQFVELRLQYKETDEFAKEIHFWDDQRKAWNPLPSDDEPVEGLVVAQTTLRYAKVAVFSNTAKRAMGQASWYRSRRYPRSAANNDYPIGSMLRVTNVENQASVDVRVISSGPFVSGRIVDLTLDAFEAIASPYRDGVIQVHLEKI